MVEAALDFVLRCQLADGTIRWSLDATGRPEGYALLTGSSSIFHALRCGVAAAEELGASRPDWELAAGRLGHAVAHHPGSFAPKNEYAMDWYYPVLCGALEGRAASARLDAGIATYVLEGLGVRCVSTNDWVTAAETAECAMALDALGRRDEALTVLAQTAAHRRGDGSYFTGLAYPVAHDVPRRARPRRTPRRPSCSPPTRSARRRPRRGCSAASGSPRRSTCLRAAAAGRRQSPAPPAERRRSTRRLPVLDTSSKAVAIASRYSS